MSAAVIDLDLSATLAPFADRLPTRKLVLRRPLLDAVAAELAPLMDLTTTLVLADAITWRIAGERAAASLTAAGHTVIIDIVAPAEGEETPVCDEAKIAAFVERLAAHRPTTVLAVGAGTINDIAKMGAYKAGLPYAVVATAPSMNGYTSAIAAILTDGVKTTQPCTPPVVCLADLDVMANAPYRMIASGLGDLISKPVSNADWRLSYRLLGSEYSREAMVLIDAGAQLLEGTAPLLPGRDPEAVGRLTGTLCLSGLAMSVAGSSAPASGGEHLISHYLDMTHYAFGESNDFHGCQVGVGTITTAALYEHLAALDPASIDIEAILAGRPDWASREASLIAHFGPLADAVLPHARATHASDEELRARLTLLVAEWPSIIADVRETLRSPASIRDELLAADCPVTFADIDVTDARARRSIIHGRDIRARYTILHLAGELGLLEAWADDVLRTWHGVPTDDADATVR